MLSSISVAPAVYLWLSREGDPPRFDFAGEAPLRPMLFSVCSKPILTGPPAAAGPPSDPPEFYCLAPARLALLRLPLALSGWL